MNRYFVRHPVVMVLTVWSLGFASAAPAADENAPTEPDAVLKHIEDRLAAAERDRAALERGVETLQRQQQQLQELRDLLNAAKDRLDQATVDLASLAQQAAEGPLSPEQEARRDLLKRRSEPDRQILSVRDPADLARARDLNQQAETLDEEWELVHEPVFHLQQEIGEMQNHAQESELKPAQREALEEFRRLVREDDEARRKEFEFVRARRAREARLDVLRETFWRDE